MQGAGLATMLCVTITSIFGTSRSKTAMAYSPPSFCSFLPNRILVTATSPSYIQTIVAASESSPLARSRKCLKDMLSLPGQGPIYIIVDGLDECPVLREGRLPVIRSWI